VVSDAWRALSSIHSLQGLTYGLYAEFQAQEAEFDYLRSMEIEERINDVRTAGIESNPCGCHSSTTRLFVLNGSYHATSVGVGTHGRDE
jgi:hypothetical protein